MAAQLFRALVDVLPAPSQRQDIAEETVVDDAVFAYVVDRPRSMLPTDLLDRAGLREIEWMESAQQKPLNTPPPPSCETASNIGVSSRKNNCRDDAADASAALPGPSTSTGHLRIIHVAPSPSFWRLPRQAFPAPRHDVHRTWSCAQGQTSLPLEPITPTRDGVPLPVHLATPSPTRPAVSMPARTVPRVHRTTTSAHPFRQDVVEMSSRESSLLADLCGVRHRAAPTSASPSRASLPCECALRVQYGPGVSS
ncbi:hypothetical protein ABB37_05587 [Leptomonas pyrrhocoris]|uniref:Uncharacterized protein n=1 Tax=Leptomonas pyrrhocoris TaxID=157538 RepID=A0A0N0DUT7_LEPPY|nr:hypothetical protein ABB37_05587 [Leptomonas pyrrhocoris]KPA79054.1 hypothetical protein ABB37_05587 [Leptomonas pyrrhocoris]|eukprot:XP_015657493.1 hypothetical protein ABB37_05587 [Leptomonas pyrrhocoris]